MFESSLPFWLRNLVWINKGFKQSSGFLLHKKEDNQQLVNVNYPTCFFSRSIRIYHFFCSICRGRVVVTLNLEPKLLNRYF